MKKEESNQQLSLSFDVNSEAQFADNSVYNTYSESGNVVDFFSVVSKKEKSEMATFEKRVLKSVTAYYNL